MSGHQSSLILRKGAVGQAFWPKSRKWHDILVVKHPKSLDHIEVRYTKAKNEYGFLDPNDLRCVKVGGSDGIIYQGMWTMCRDARIQSEIADLSGYGFGVIASVVGNPSPNAGFDVLKEIEIEFEFAATGDDNDDGLPSCKIQAKGSDLLYWAVPKDLTDNDAKTKMMVGKTLSDSAEEEESSEEGHNGRPARKRSAVAKFDPSPRPRCAKVIQDDDEASGESSVDRELFPDSDSEQEESSGDERETVQGRKSSGSARLGSSSWGTPDNSHGSLQGSPSWGVAMSSEFNDSSGGWGKPTNTVTPDSGKGWGRSSSLAASTSRGGGWGHSQSSGGASESNAWHSTSTFLTPALQYRQMPQSRSTRVKSKYAIQSEGSLEVIRETDDDFFLRWYFGSGNVKVFEVSGSCPSLETSKDIGGQTYALVASKYEKQEARPSKFHAGKFGAAPYVKAFYVQGDAATVQKELNTIANFSELGLNPGKLASRLELLVSTAARAPTGEKEPYIRNLPISDIEEVDLPDNQTMGCGFIPSALLEEVLGHGTDAKEAVSVQVRVICPCLGIFKGELERKAAIRKMQLPASMKKVGKSTATKKAFDTAFVLINSVCPSKSNIMMERHLNPHSTKAPTKSSESDLRGLGPMMKSMLLGCGIPGNELERYDKETHHQYYHRKHAYLTGVCDCTGGGLPPGTVFITGLGVGGLERKVFITRSPCTERGDAKVVLTVTEKPVNMSEKDWKHICSLAFGAVMFSSPTDANAMSLPESINNSDLDGDLFFCLWEPTLVPYLEASLLNDNNDEAGVQKEREGMTVQQRSEEDNDDDELLGLHVPLKIDGKTCDALVTGKDREKYVVEWGDHKRTLSYEELTADRAIVEDVVGHRGKGRNAEVEVLWRGGKRSWQAFDLMKEEAPDAIAEYALQKNLLDQRGWKWTKDYIRDAEIIKIRSHRCHGNTVKVEVLYDGDTTPTWTNAKSIDVDILATYVEENGISLSDRHWKWLDKSIKKAKRSWFSAAQERVSDVRHMAEHSRLVESLHRAHKKRGDITSESAVHFGRAFKKALDVGKHGGRVPLPRALRVEVAPGKKAAYYDKFLKDI